MGFLDTSGALVKRFAFAAAGVLVAALVLVASAGASDLYGLTVDNQLVRFDPANPGLTREQVAVTGLASGESLLGISSWSVDGRTYGLGSSNRIYKLDPPSGVATEGYQLSTGQAGQITSLSLAGSSFGFAHDASGGAPPGDPFFQIVSDSGQALRVSYIPCTCSSSGTLSYASGDVNDAKTPHVTATALTAPTDPSISPIQYGIDTSLGVLVTISNDVVHTVGPLGISATDPTALVVTEDGRVLMATRAGGSGGSTLYGVNASTGAATAVGAIGSGLVLRSLEVVQPPQIRVRSSLGEPPPVTGWATEISNDPSANGDIWIQRTGDPDPRVTVDYATGTPQPQPGCGGAPGCTPSNIAIPGIDYAPAAGTAVFEPGQDLVVVPMRFLDSDRGPFFAGGSGTEAGFTLANPIGAPIQPNPPNIFLVIDFGPELEPSTLSVDRSAGQAIVAIDRRADQATTPETLNYATNGGSARPMFDYTPVAGQVTFAPGETRKTFTIPIAGNVHDGTQTIGVSVAPTIASRQATPAAAMSGDHATVTILDPPTATGKPQRKLLVSLRVHRFREQRAVLPVAFSCSARCTGRMSLTIRTPAKQTTIATAQVSDKPGRHAVALLRLSHAAMKRLRHAHRLRTTLTADLTDPLGGHAITTRPITLRTT